MWKYDLFALLIIIQYILRDKNIDLSNIKIVVSIIM